PSRPRRRAREAAAPAGRGRQRRRARPRCGRVRPRARRRTVLRARRARAPAGSALARAAVARAAAGVAGGGRGPGQAWRQCGVCSVHAQRRRERGRGRRVRVGHRAARRRLAAVRAPVAAGVPAHAAASRPHLRVLHRAAAQGGRVSLERAVAIARAAGKRAHPKPTVGAVLVRGGETVAEGVTEPGGRHAEAVALAAAGERARGATMYVTLEPCAHHGSNPPCADAIVAAGVERVVVGVADPNPEAAGGADTLRRGGVEVIEARDWAPRVLHEAWRTWVVHGRPFVVFKAAVTLDGRVVVPGRRWVSGGESRRLVHELRAEVDAVAVGGGTAQADRPRLDARGVETPRGQP